jgi:hypothetical protein
MAESSLSPALRRSLETTRNWQRHTLPQNGAEALKCPSFSVAERALVDPQHLGLTIPEQPGIRL